MAEMKVPEGKDFFDPGEHSAAHKSFGFSASASAPHPMGHDKVTKAVKRFDGSMVEHHAHGGKTVHHLGGMVTHHTPTGRMLPPTPMMAPPGAPDASGPPSMPDTDGDGMKDGGSVGNASKQYAIGGRVRLPRGMKPVEARTHSPINTPPRNPRITKSPTGSMPGGVSPYGVQPSDEPGYSPQSDTTDGPADNGMKKGGKVRR